MTTIRNFDSRAAKVIASARRKLISNLICLAITTVGGIVATVALFPPDVEITGRLFGSAMMLVFSITVGGTFLAMLLTYLSNDRRKIEDEVAARMVYMHNMMDKPPMPVQTTDLPGGNRVQ